MFENIPLDLELSEAEAMDSLYDSHKSIKKKGDLLNQKMDTYLPDQITYLVMIILQDFLDKDEPEYGSVDRLLRMINFEVVEGNVLIAFLKMLKPTSHLYKEHTKFYKSSVLRLNDLNIDADKIIKDI